MRPPILAQDWAHVPLLAIFGLKFESPPLTGSTLTPKQTKQLLIAGGNSRIFLGGKIESPAPSIFHNDVYVKGRQ